MKHKTPLLLMEQLLMLLVFALAAAVFLQAFAAADGISRHSRERSRAAAVAQTAAERWKAGEDVESVAYDKNWQTEAEKNAAYRLSLAETAEEYLEKAKVTVTTAEGEELFSLTVARQREVSGDG